MKLLERKPGHDRHLEQSFLAQRRGMSILAGAFPCIFLISSFVLHRTEFQDSISAYYWTLDAERNLFVGVLCAIAVFLVLYKGYNTLEDRVLDLAGICAAGVALVPMVQPGTEGKSIHPVFAVTFFFCIFYVCIFMSRKSLEEMPDSARRERFRTAYAWCAGVMIGSVVASIAAQLLLPKDYLRMLLDHSAIFWLEALSVWSFAAFWYIKTRELDASVSWVPFRKKPTSGTT